MYGVDLLDVFTGNLTMRRLDVLVRCLPPGSRLQRVLGGPGAWSDTVSAIHQEGHLIRSNITSVLGAKKPPQPVEPPEPGWFEKAKAREERATRKRARFRSRRRQLNKRQGPQ